MPLRSQLTALLLMALFTTGASSQRSPNPCVHGTAHVKGIIRDYNGMPAPGARLHLAAIEWRSDCRNGRGVLLEARTDSMGVYEITAPASKATLTIENRYRNGDHDRFALLQDSVLTGEVRLDYQFTRLHVEGNVLGKDGRPWRVGRLMYFLRPTSWTCCSGSPEVPVRDGRFEIDVSPPGEYVFWSFPLEEMLTTAIPIHSDTTVTIDLREMGQDAGRSK